MNPDFDEILAEILKAEESGQVRSPDEWADNYPQWSDSIREFFDNRRQLELTNVFREDRDTPTIVSGDGQVEPAEPAPGDSLQYFGDYEIEAELARGGMGVVYRAVQKSLGRTVAIKMILAGELASEEHVARFRSEAEAAAGLDHPGIVPIYEIGEYHGQHYFSMAYIAGSSLAEQITQGPLAPQEAARIVADAASAVQFAHDREVIHRDLKPANLLMDGTQPKVTDFGLAKRLDRESMTATGEMLGTPGYMAPEQAQGAESAGKPTDVYGLGAILYATLTGRPPFQAANVIETLRQLVEVDPPSPRALNPEVPPDLETICLAALRKEPERRYASAAALEADLRRFLDGRPITARPVSPAEHAWKWARRHPVTAGLSSALLLSLICGSAIIASLWLDARVSRDAARAASVKAKDEAARAVAARRVADQKTDQAKEALVSSSLRLADVMYATGQRADAEAGYVAQLRQAEREQTSDRRAYWRLWRTYSENPRQGWLSVSGRGLVSGANGSTVAVLAGTSVHLIDADTLQRKRTVTSPDGHLGAVALSPSGRWLAASDANAPTISLWDLAEPNPAPRKIQPGKPALGDGMKAAVRNMTGASQALLKRAEAQLGARAGLFFADDSKLLIGGNGALWSFHTETSETHTIATGRRGPGTCLPVAVDDERIWMVSFGAMIGVPLCVLHTDPDTQRPRVSYPGIADDKLIDIPAPGGLLASLNLAPQFVSQLPEEAQQQILQSRQYSVHAPTNRLAVIRDGVLSVWDLREGRQHGKLPGFADAVRSSSAVHGVVAAAPPDEALIFSPDGTRLAVVGAEVTIVDVESMTRMQTFGWFGTPGLMSGAFSSDNTRLLLVEQKDLGSRAQIGVYSAVKEATPDITAISRPQLAAGSTAIAITREPGQPLFRVSRPSLTVLTSDTQSRIPIPTETRIRPRQLLCSADGRRAIVFGNRPGKPQQVCVAAIATRSGQVEAVTDLPGQLMGIAVSQNGDLFTQIASSGVVIRSIPSFEERGRIDVLSGSLFPKPDSADGKWGITQGAIAFSPDARHVAMVLKTLAFNEERAAVVASNPPELVVMDIESMRIVSRIKCPDTFKVHFVQDGRMLAIAARVGGSRVEFYSVPNLESRGSWKHSESPATAFCEDQDQNLLVCGTESGEMCFLDLAGRESLARVRVTESSITQLRLDDENAIRFATGGGVGTYSLQGARVRLKQNLDQWAR